MRERGEWDQSCFAALPLTFATTNADETTAMLGVLGINPALYRSRRNAKASSDMAVRSAPFAHCNCIITLAAI